MTTQREAAPERVDVGGLREALERLVKAWEDGTTQDVSRWRAADREIDAALAQAREALATPPAAGEPPGEAGPWKCPTCGGLGAHTVTAGDGGTPHSFRPGLTSTEQLEAEQRGFAVPFAAEPPRETEGLRRWVADELGTERGYIASMTVDRMVEKLSGFLAAARPTPALAGLDVERLARAIITEGSLSHELGADWNRIVERIAALASAPTAGEGLSNEQRAWAVERGFLPDPDETRVES